MKKLLITLSFATFVFVIAACGKTSTAAPTIQGVDDGTVLQGSVFDPMEGVTATDYDGRDITADIEIDGFVNTLILGEHVVVYTVTDDKDKTTTVNRFITVVFETEAPYALYNGDFSLDTGGWNMDRPGGSATFTVIDNELNVDISNPGTQWWSIQLHQTVSIEQGESYRISIEAKSETGKRLGLGVEDTQDGYVMLPGGNVAFDLTTEYDTYSFIYTSDRTIDSAKVVIYLGRVGDDDNGTDVVINEISVEHVVLDTTDITFSGLEEAILFIGDAFDPLAGVTALDQDGTDITGDIVVTGLVETDVANAQTFILQYTVTAQGETLVQNRSVRVILPIANPAEIFNPTFDMGLTGWTVDFPSGVGSAGTMTVVDGVVEADLTELGTAWWHIQLSQGGIHLVEGKSYEVTIVAKADGPKRIGLGVENPADGFRSQLAGPVEWNLTDEFVTYTHIFTAPESITTGKYAIFMGRMAGTDAPTTVYIEEFSVTELADAYPSISGVSSVRIEAGTPFDALEGVTANDLEDGDLTSAIELSGTYDIDTVGVYVITYSVTDSAGNTTTVNRTITVIEPTEGGMSVVENPTFTEGTGWNFDFSAGTGTMEYVEGTVVINVTDPGSDFWHIQLQQDGITLVEGKAYLVTVRIMTDTPRTIGLALEDAADGFAGLAPEPVDWAIGEEWTTLYYVFRATRSTDNGKLGLFIGQITGDAAPGEIVVSYFNMVEADTQNLLANSNFENDTEWVYDFPVGTGTMEAIDNQLIADITSVGDAWWNVQLVQENIEIDANTSYLMTFRLSSSEARRIGLITEDPADGYRDLKGGVPQEWDVDDEMVTYFYVFNSQDTIDTAKIGLFFGFHTTGDGPSVITIENFMMIKLYDFE